MALFQPVEVAGILARCTLQCSDHIIEAKSVNSQVLYFQFLGYRQHEKRKCLGYRQHEKLCSTSNSQVRYASGLYIPSNRGIFNFSFATC
jgi:hypothetical protein